MLLSVGTKVRLLRTGDEGWVDELLEEGMVSVYLPEEQMSIPVFVVDLARSETTTASKIPAKLVAGKQEKKVVKPDSPDLSGQYAILNPQGIQLAFDPVLRNDATPEKYNIFIINDSRRSYLYVFQFFTKGELRWETRGRLQPGSYIDTGFLQFEELNETPEIVMQCWEILAKGSGPLLLRRMKLKPAMLFKRLITAPLLNRLVHLIKVYDSLDPKEKPKNASTSGSLADYTEKQKKSKPAGQWTKLENFSHEVWQLATFSHELDLHIDKLSADPQKLSPGDILALQMRHFEQFIHDAYKLGVERVFVIHGLGEGKLRAAIARRLKEMHEVSEYKNEYHPKYGWGATEVIFS